jgi:hypothetical protein
VQLESFFSFLFFLHDPPVTLKSDAPPFLTIFWIFQLRLSVPAGNEPDASFVTVRGRVTGTFAETSPKASVPAGLVVRSKFRLQSGVAVAVGLGVIVGVGVGVALEVAVAVIVAVAVGVRVAVAVAVAVVVAVAVAVGVAVEVAEEVAVGVAVAVAVEVAVAVAVAVAVGVSVEVGDDVEVAVAVAVGVAVVVGPDSPKVTVTGLVISVWQLKLPA